MAAVRDVWNSRYRDHGSLYGTEPNQFVRTELADLDPCRVLDLGCGQGRNAIWLAARGHAVTALDVSDVAIGHARELAGSAGVTVEFRAVDIARSWTPELRYDVVLSSYFQLPGRTREIVHRKLVEALVPGGRLFLIAHHADNLIQGVGGPPMPEVLFDERLLADDFSTLTVIRNQKVYRTVATDDGERTAHDILFEAVKPAR